jgi:5-methylcytosine-specific restriction enzyme subunit McrC
MLLYAWQLARFRGRLDVEHESSPELEFLLARVLVEVTRDLLRRGIHRDYLERSASLTHLRGRVEVGETIRHLELVHGRVTCRFDELDPNVLANRILRTTFLRLIHSQQLRAEASDVHRQVVDIYRRLEGIEPLPSVRPEHFGLVRIDRNNAAYRLVMEICKFLADVALPTEGAGRDPFLGLLNDEIKMNRVFEAFVRNFYRMHCPDYRVGSEILRWPEESNRQGLLPGMKTDVSLSSKTRRIVIEAKYYRETLTEQYGRATFRSPHLYQLYAYLRTQEEVDAVHGAAEGILLYPAVGMHLDEMHRIQQHAIRIVTVDLDLPWREIEHRLRRLVLTNDGEAA